MSRSSRSKRIENDVDAEDISGTKDLDVLPSFEAMGLKEDLLRGVYGYGFERPSAIQQRAIKPIVQGRDVIAQSQSGTGKTGMKLQLPFIFFVLCCFVCIFSSNICLLFPLLLFIMFLTIFFFVSSSCCMEYSIVL